ncbi:hypothetical protein C8Q73DRAFT_789617 [Cubamyces lactineus]|nr:hypothetical protein C8Q73DRAFT_789617 [Cubamyces lactineus]
MSLPSSPVGSAESVITDGRTGVTHTLIALCILHKLANGFSVKFPEVGLEPHTDTDFEFVPVEDLDEHYVLYHACLRYLESAYPLGTLFDSIISNKPFRTPLTAFPPCFGALVNSLADMMENDAYSTSLTCESPALSRSFLSIAIAIAFSNAVYEALQGNEGANTIALVRAGQVGLQNWWYIMFLDIVTQGWRNERKWRNALGVASLVPWSDITMDETTSAASITIQMNVWPKDLRPQLDDFPSPDCPQLEYDRWRLACPADIRWLGAKHDGYALSDTLAGYIALRRQKGAVRSFQDDAALWLSAMTFGLLEAITRLPIPESILVPGEHEGETIISGVRLSRFILWFKHLCARLPSPQRPSVCREHLDYGRHVAQLLRDALGALEAEMISSSSVLVRSGVSSAERLDICCSVAMMISYLWTTFHADFTLTRWAAVPELQQPIYEYLERNSCGMITNGISLWCTEKLVARGWCPNALPALCARPAFYFVVPNLLRLTPYNRDHPGEHARCREDACLLFTVADEDQYVPRHVDPACRCSYIKPSQEDVQGLLSQGRIPIVLLIGEELQVRSAPAVPYVAISHVWAEGMGSTTEVGLPGCMVRRIGGLVQRLLPDAATGAGAFWWMDSLCVPGVRGQRKRAIGLMAQTYRDAAKVLVVDDSIRTMCSATLPGASLPDETLVRIGVSRWMRRVWTLQEALLARELYFEFKDGLVNVEEHLLPPLTLALGAFPARHEAPIFDVREKRRTARSLNSVLGGDDGEDSMMMENVVRLLRGRRTTKPEDELVAIASLLPPRVKLDALLATSGVDGRDLAQRRMRVLLLQLRDVPRAVPFCVSPRLALPGFAWAPRLLVQDEESAMGTWDGAHGTAVCGEDGLVGEYLFASCGRGVEIPGKVPVVLLRDRLTGGLYVLTAPSLPGLSKDAGDADDTAAVFDGLLFLNRKWSTLGSQTGGMYCLAVSTVADGVTTRTPGCRQSSGSLSDWPVETTSTGASLVGRGGASLTVKYVACCPLATMPHPNGAVESLLPSDGVVPWIEAPVKTVVKLV